LGISRSAVWKQIQRLPEWGLEVHASPGHGYRLERPMELMQQEALERWLEPEIRAVLRRLDLFQEVDSTNGYLLRQPPPPPGALSLALTEFQRAGRGRRGRSWSTPFGCGVMLSVGWQFERPPSTLAALSLAIGVAAREVLSSMGVGPVKLKWPNDLVWQQGKLGGILVEVSGDAQGPCHVVIGIGINVFLSAQARAGIEYSWGRGPVDLTDAGTGDPPSRNQLAGALVNHVYSVLARYETQGFGAYRQLWHEADALAGQVVVATGTGGPVIGQAAGVDADGALLVLTNDGTQRVTSGEVRVQT